MAASLGRTCATRGRLVASSEAALLRTLAKAGPRSRQGIGRVPGALLHADGACSQGCMVDPEEVRRQLEAALPGARIEVANPAGDGEHLEVHVATAAFAGLGLVEQHRMVYAALGDLMPRIHALQLRTEVRGEGAR